MTKATMWDNVEAHFKKNKLVGATAGDTNCDLMCDRHGSCLPDIALLFYSRLQTLKDGGRAKMLIYREVVRLQVRGRVSLMPVQCQRASFAPAVTAVVQVDDAECLHYLHNHCRVQRRRSQSFRSRRLTDYDHLSALKRRQRSR